MAVLHTGWTRGVTVPFYLFAGVAVSDDGGRSFTRFPARRCSTATTSIRSSPRLRTSSSRRGRWRMGCVSAAKWQVCNGEPRHYYHIRYAESHDGISLGSKRNRLYRLRASGRNTRSRGLACCATAASIRMWYSWRGVQYRLGYARIDRRRRLDPDGRERPESPRPTAGGIRK